MNVTSLHVLVLCGRVGDLCTFQIRVVRGYKDRVVLGRPILSIRRKYVELVG